MEAPVELKAAWIWYCGVGLGGCGPFATLDMGWFASRKLRQTNHQAQRQAERDPVKALKRIRSAGGRGLHPLFGPPLVADSRDDCVIIAAHDVCVVANVVQDPGTLVVITTLPMKPRGPYKTFSEFVKCHGPAAYRRHQEALARRRNCMTKRRQRNRCYRLPRKQQNLWS